MKPVDKPLLSQALLEKIEKDDKIIIKGRNMEVYVFKKLAIKKKTGAV